MRRLRFCNGDSLPVKKGAFGDVVPDRQNQRKMAEAETLGHQQLYTRIRLRFFFL
jgi:hypothetical protein